ncbi:MAG: GtrA family protein [Actinomycetota bacterium]|nr:GtrA family protein [Actinomycetota bacterium]
MPAPDTSAHPRLKAARRFVLLGGANTLLTFALFTALQHVTQVAVAYTAAFAAGLVFSTALTGRVVFGVRTTSRRRMVFALCYLLIYGVGLLVSHFLAGGLPAWAVSAGTLAVTAPLGFLAGQAVLVPPAATTRWPSAPPPPRETGRSP